MPRSLFGQLTDQFAARDARPSRRQLLKGALAASAGLLLSDLLTGCRGSPSPRRVVIVGAGFAGLACAHELVSAGYSVTVFESRKRIGGRVVTFKDFVDGKTVEGGGELIGTNHPTWIALARQFDLNLVAISQDEPRNNVVFDGVRLSPGRAHEMYTFIKEGASLMCGDAGPVNADEPWNSPDAAALDRRSLADAIAAMNIDPLGKRGLTVEFTQNSGMTPAQASYLAMLVTLQAHGLEKYWTETETHRCQGGNQQLADKLARSLEEGRLHLDIPVKAIRLTSGRATVESADGRLHEADDVVLAVPPSVWHKIRVEPALPAELEVQMGNNIKYLAEVRDRFWVDVSSPNSMTDGQMGWTWELTDGQPGAAAALVSFSGGPVAHACRALAADQRRQMYLREFDKLMPGFSAKFVHDRFMDWPSDPWTLGSYSFPAPGKLTLQGPTLRQGVGRLHFAGEHTSKFRGYMEGALHSGVSLARRLAERDGVVAP